jgi:large subunit ribosomal protein L21
MFAIIRAGGKQYKVQAGDTVRVEKLEKNLGDVFNVTEVLMVGGDKTFVGAPLVQNAIVTAVVTRQAKGAKVIVFKKKRRQGYRKMQGHRQFFTELFIQSITTPEGLKGETDKKAQIIDPAKIAARKTDAAAKQKATKKTKSSSMMSELSAGAGSKDASKKTTKKKVAKKTASKKTSKTSGPKKAASKKTVSKKK